MKNEIKKIKAEIIQRKEVKELPIEQILFILDIVEDSVIHYDILLKENANVREEI